MLHIRIYFDDNISDTGIGLSAHTYSRQHILGKFELQVETFSLYIIRCMKEPMEKKANGIPPIAFFVWMK